jgi:hypothetical protein
MEEREESDATWPVGVFFRKEMSSRFVLMVAYQTTKTIEFGIIYKREHSF